MYNYVETTFYNFVYITIKPQYKDTYLHLASAIFCWHTHHYITSKVFVSFFRVSLHQHMWWRSTHPAVLVLPGTTGSQRNQPHWIPLGLWPVLGHKPGSFLMLGGKLSGCHSASNLLQLPSAKTWVSRSRHFLQQHSSCSSGECVKLPWLREHAALQPVLGGGGGGDPGRVGSTSGG